MKKFKYIATLFLGLSLSPLTYSYVSGKITTTENLIYCPEQITCTEAKNYKSCTYNTTDSRYWDHVGGGEPERVVAGSYKYINAAASYHSSTRLGWAMCMYENTSKGISNTIALYAKFGANLEAYYDKATKWDLIRYPEEANCRTDSPLSCPLHEGSSLGFLIKDIKEPLFVNGSSILNYSNLRYEDALAIWGCSSAKQCNIDITNEQHVLIGSIIVDMDNKLKILKIIPLSSSGIDIKQIESFNSVKIKIADIPPVLSAVEIYNKINSDISASVDNIRIMEKPLASREQGKIFSDRAVIGCKGVAECKIDIITSKGGLLGSIVVDMENKMNILQVIPLRSSEIVINKIDANSIEIKYLNLISKN